MTKRDLKSSMSTPSGRLVQKTRNPNGTRTSHTSAEMESRRPAASSIPSSTTTSARMSNACVSMDSQSGWSQNSRTKYCIRIFSSSSFRSRPSSIPEIRCHTRGLEAAQPEPRRAQLKVLRRSRAAASDLCNLAWTYTSTGTRGTPWSWARCSHCRAIVWISCTDDHDLPVPAAAHTSTGCEGWSPVARRGDADRSGPASDMTSATSLKPET
mmetsp:Transcript_2992/g.8960  ORF Transcript_2992/g.8960 Transcript_2992/m.8960 type:complete len:212 (-) Transcript_2992:1148-1783(-)